MSPAEAARKIADRAYQRYLVTNDSTEALVQVDIFDAFREFAELLGAPEPRRCPDFPNCPCCG